MGRLAMVGFVVALLVASAGSASAGMPRAVTIAHHATPTSGNFIASGAINEVGTVTREEAQFTAVNSPTVGTGQFVYTFHGQAGSLTVRLQWLLTATDVPSIGHVDGRWVVIDGTGAYSGMQGAGDYSATIDFVLMQRDAVFSGQVH